MRRVGMLSVVSFALILVAAPAFAGPGLHAGFSIDPDDFLIGLQYRHPLAEDFTLVPSVEAGFGDVTMIAGNLDLHYLLPLDTNLAPYVGGGITVNWFDFEDDSETEFGGSILAGMSLNPKFFLEGKVGLGDVPDFKLYVGVHRP